MALSEAEKRIWNRAIDAAAEKAIESLRTSLANGSKTNVWASIKSLREPEEDNMFKHANQMFPGQKVARADQKVASHGQGKLAEKQLMHDGRLHVLWDDGSESFEKPEDLTKIDS